MIVAEDIYSFTDQLIIGVGTPLTDRIITRLKFYSIDTLLVYQTEGAKTAAKPAASAHQPAAENKPPVPEAVVRPLGTGAEHLDAYIPQPSYISRIKQSQEFRTFSRAFSASLVAGRGQITRFLNGQGTLSATELLQGVSLLRQASPGSSGVFDMLMCIRELDDATFVHGLHVALLCSVMGSWLKLPKEEQDALTLAGLLHDIGKLKLPKDILSKPDRLTVAEYALVQQHTRYGYELLRELPLDDRIKTAALFHHERCDGSGYPSGLSSAQIPEFAKIIGILDVYDAMVAARPYRGPVCPLEVVGIFEAEGLKKYDPKYLLTFLDGVVNTYLHHTALLNTGEKGEIIMINRYSLSRPVLHMESNRYLDLAKEPELTITGII